jgi:hypothetical protein
MDASTQASMSALMEVTLGIKEETVSDKGPKLAPRKRRKSLGWGAAAGPMARLVYHDLRHPLTAILAYSEFLAKDDLDASERQDLHQEICLAVTRMNDLISSLLEASKDSQSQLPRVADIVSTVARGIRTVAVRPEFRCIAIRYEHAGATQGRFDAGGLQQVIANMVLNACEAVSPYSGRVEVRSLGRQDSVEISISDNGPGIPEPIRRVLFQESVSHDKDGGMGLGLAIVQKVVCDHGGHVYLDATGENGTVFKLDLPFKKRKPRAPTSPNNVGPIELVQALQTSRLQWPDHKGGPATHPGSRDEGRRQELGWPRGRTGVVRRRRQPEIVGNVPSPNLIYTRWQASLLEETR